MNPKTDKTTANTTNKENFVYQYLQQLGLSENESLIFQTLLEKGNSTILQLSRNTGIERTKIYGIANRMLRDGLVEEVIDYKRKYLKPCSITKIKELIDNQTHKTEYLKNSYNTLKSHLKAYERTASPAQVKFYRGVDGIKQVLWNELKTKTEILAYTARDFYELWGYKTLEDEYAREFKIRNVKIKDLRSLQYLKTRSDSPSKKVLFGQNRKFIDPKILDIKASIDIYDNTVLTFEWHNADPFAIEIIDEQFAEMQRKMFNHFWKLAEPWDVEKLKKKYL